MIEYKVLKEIELNPTQTQRGLAAKLDISLGKVNYVMAGLVEKGVIKARKLRDEPGKIRWQYILTPKGMKEKMLITKHYLRVRMDEFAAMQQEIAELQEEIGEKTAQEICE